MEKLLKRLSEVKAILAQAQLTEGKSLDDIRDWNNYHDEQSDLEFDIRAIELEVYNTCESYAR